MPKPSDLLPISKTETPGDAESLAAVVRGAHVERTPLYPIGGGTSLDFGLPAKAKGVGLSLSGLNRVVDYPARDMTITVEAGIRMRQLAEILAAEKQRLPIDPPHPDAATLGGVIATNFNGPRRYGEGSIRDYVIGITAIDGRGVAFKGGGRVVKNVAGYDFCKLLTGSLGTLGVISQVTLKVRPQPEAMKLVAISLDSDVQAERVLAALSMSQTTPSAIELVAGPEWEKDPALGSFFGKPVGDIVPPVIVVALEGTAIEVAWMHKQLLEEMRGEGVSRAAAIGDAEATAHWQRLCDFPQSGDAALVIKGNMVAEGTVPFTAALREVDPKCSIAAHAGNGIVVARFPQFPSEGLSRVLLGKLMPVASKHHGSVVVLSNPSGAEVTRSSTWGGIDIPFSLMTEIKRQFDPANILNPGRFVYGE